MGLAESNVTQLAERFKELASRAKTTVRLHPRQAESKDAAASKLGGKFPFSWTPIIILLDELRKLIARKHERSH